MLWAVEADDTVVIPMLGEMIVCALVRGTELGDVVLRANNVTVEFLDDEDHEGAGPAEGDYVALTILGVGDWPEISWKPGARDRAVLLNADLDARARAAGVSYAYSRAAPEGGSVTVFLPRLV
jgi:hypothetical protein